jgi:DNA-binding XRE family transcriptional regulator
VEGVKDQVMQEKKKNLLKIYREQLFISKAELARNPGISAATIDRIEKGKGCHLETKKKIILALGLELSEADKIFGRAIFTFEPRDKLWRAVSQYDKDSNPLNDRG